MQLVMFLLLSVFLILGKTVYTKIFNILKGLLLFLVYNIGESMETTYKVEKLTQMDASCKKAIAVLVTADSQVLKLTSFFPSLIQLANKYRSPENYRPKRDLGFLIDILNRSSTIVTVNSIEKLLQLADPCLSWTRSYVKFWIRDIFKPILSDQFNRFSVGLTNKLVKIGMIGFSTHLS